MEKAFRFVTGILRNRNAPSDDRIAQISEAENMEKRRHPRTVLHHFSFDASDGSRFYQGVVFDVSRNGICMTNLPRMTGGTARKMWVVVSGSEHKFKMQVTPKWATDKGCGKTIGAEIVRPPPGWAEFIAGFEQKNDPETYNFIHS